MNPTSAHGSTERAAAEPPRPLDVHCGTMIPVRWTACCVLWAYRHGDPHAPDVAEDKVFEMDVIVQTTLGRWEYAGRRGLQSVDADTLVAGVAGRDYGCRHDPRFPDRNLIASLRAGARDDDEPLFTEDTLRRACAPRLERALAACDDDCFESRIYEAFEAVSLRSRGDRAPRPAGRVRMERAKRFIEAHAFEGIMLPDVARAVGLTPFNTLRQFKNHVGVTPHAYLDALRVREARRRLVSSPLPIGAVAKAIGIHDAAYFARWFARSTGSTPSAFRRAHR